MTSQHDLQEIAGQIKTAQDCVQQIQPLTSTIADFDLDSAYAVSKLIHEARLRDGAVAVGRKIGFTNPDMWECYGVRAPIWAYVYETTVVRVTDGHCAFGIGRFAEPKIEPEIVFHFHSSPPVGGDLMAILECVDWVAHAFEIVQSNFPGWKFQAADTIADSALHGALLVGEPKHIDKASVRFLATLASFSVELSCNQAIREVGVGSNVLGNPVAAIAHLLSVLAKQTPDAPLQANEIVTTGTITTAQSVRVGETWRSVLRGIALPGLSVEFVE
jgi:2-keto-4-pentenoate hydratase